MSGAVLMELPLDQILRGDCVEVMQTLPTGSIDCIFADPPYNLQLRGELRRPDDSVVDGVDDDWDKFADLAEYDRFTRAWLAEARRLLRKDGTIWVIGSYHNIFRLGAILQDLGFWILNDIIWRKSNPMPNFRGRRFTNAHETLIWAARGPDSRYRFNYQAMKALNDDVQMRSDWYLPLCTGGERLRNAHGLKLHPTQKPESLLHRVLIASTNVDDIVLDPFAGTGTTTAMARRLRRRYIGIERHPDYAEAAIGRARRERPVPLDSVLTTPAKREIPRIPFGSLVERGLLPAGTLLYDRQKRVSATVSPDGTLVSGTQRGSIHKLGALLTNAPSCNGWTFWHLQRDDRMIPLDTLRGEALTQDGNVQDSHVRDSHVQDGNIQAGDIQDGGTG
ncbi:MULTISPECIES: DNA methyltransferase [Nguyenibacter]|uniref:site-specific DNA-methyltransferase n=1 Tax=Nguyenibacter TaxID=1519186 RepID=UPI001FE4632B|nr:MULTISPECIES: DNA methyltransferase [Nguyenibacter]WRH87532.1 DNA methyltransferase [Nguyenibacter sp. L1]